MRYMVPTVCFAPRKVLWPRKLRCVRVLAYSFASHNVFVGAFGTALAPNALQNSVGTICNVRLCSFEICMFSPRKRLTSCYQVTLPMTQRSEHAGFGLTLDLVSRLFSIALWRQCSAKGTCDGVLGRQSAYKRPFASNLAALKPILRLEAHCWNHVMYCIPGAMLVPFLT